MAQPFTPSEDRGRKAVLHGTLSAAVFILVLTFVAFVPAMRSGFIWDDDVFLYENQLIHASDGLKRFWFSTESPDYFPLTSSTLWLEWRLWGKNPAGYHVTNVFLHALSALLLWRVLLRLKTPGAWLAACVFAIHPVNVESVIWITERKNTLSMLLYVLAALAFLRAEDEISTGRRGWYWGAVVAFVLALLAKTSVVMLPVVLLGFAWWRRGSVTRNDWMRATPFFAASALLAMVTIWFQYHRAISVDVVRSDSMVSRLAVAGMAIWFYLVKAIVPVDLCFVYPRWQVNALSPLAHLPWLAVAGCLGLFAWRRRSWGRGPLFGFGYFVVSLLPVLGFFNIYFMNYSLVSDHWQYVAIVGVIAFFVGGAARLLARPRLSSAARPAGAALLAVLFVLSWRQQAAYRNEEALWRDTVDRNPEAVLAHTNLGRLLDCQGRLEEALAHLDKAAALRPDDAVIHHNLANVLSGLDRHEEALKHCQEAVRLRPAFPDAYSNAARALLGLNRPAEAAKYARDALRGDPKFAEAHVNLGLALVRTGDREGGIRSFETALQYKPDLVDALSNLGCVLAEAGRHDEAFVRFERALRVDPQNARTHFNYGVALSQRGLLGKARQHLEQAVRLAPDWPEPAERLRRLPGEAPATLSPRP